MSMNLQVLKNELEKGIIRKVYLFYGEEEYLKDKYAKQIETAIVEPGLSMMNKTVFQGNVSLQLLSECCETLPMMAGKRLVIVKNSNMFKSSKEVTGEFADFIKQLPEHVCLLFLEIEADKRIKAFNVVKEHGLPVEMQLQKPADLAKWLIAAAKHQGKKLEESAAFWMVENSSGYMYELENELNKVVLSADSSTITVQDVQRVCIKSVKAKIFDLTDAIAEKDISSALKIYYDMVALKEPIPKILYMIARHFRLLLEMRTYVDRNIPRQQALEMSGMKSFPGNKLYDQAKKIAKDKIVYALKQCVNSEEAFKSGVIKDETAVEILMVSLCSL